MTVQDLFKQLGGPQKVADALRVPFTTVSSWSQRDRIPPWRLGDVAELALKSNIAVPPALAKLPSERAA